MPGKSAGAGPGAGSRPCHIALIRGINVGRAKRVAMADLRVLVESLDYRDVRTLLNSGNVVFTIPGAAGKRADPASRIEKAMAARLGVPASVIVLTNRELAAAVAGNPLQAIADDPARLLLGFVKNKSQGDLRKLAPLTREEWTPEVLAVRDGVAYLWCPRGISNGKLFEAVNRALGDAVTTRNLATATKLLALAGG